MSTNPEVVVADQTIGVAVASPRLTARQLRDLLGVLLIVAGMAGLLAVLFVVQPLLCYGALSVATIAVGVYLGLER